MRSSNECAPIRSRFAMAGVKDLPVVQALLAAVPKAFQDEEFT
jgi:hypothetical protein